MSDVTSTETPAPPETTTPTTPPSPNSAEARTPDGTLKDVSPPPGDTPPPAVVPETYAEFRAPEGATLDKELIAGALPIFKELGLTQDQAQKLVDFQAAQAIAKGKEMESVVSAMRKDWRDQVSADPDLGPKLDSIKADFGRALNTLDPKVATDFRAALDLTGAGDHPAIIKVMSQWAKTVVEGKHVSGGGPSEHGQTPNGVAAKPSAARALYPNNP